ncbi:MAG: DEAD/DEAH box helicase, partial [Thermoproteota archaeon]
MKDHDQIQQKNQFPDSVLDSLFAHFGFTNLTEIQKKASPIILQKKDCLVIAPTGSGKTECSVIPVFSLVKKSKKLGKIKVLYITPLRALNRDVFRRITKYAQYNDLSIEIRHGDTTQTARRKITENPPDVLITTPETLVILLTQIKMLDALSELEWIVIDEVHELLASERGSQLSLSIERLQINSKLYLTKIGLSATVGNFKEAGKFVVGTKRKCQIIRDISVRNYDVEVKFVNGTISDVADKIIEHVLELNLDSPILLFTNTRGEAEFLASILKEKSTINIELHHGSLSKEVREDTELTLREGKRGIVVCTSSLELGLDIGSIELV